MVESCRLESGSLVTIDAIAVSGYVVVVLTRGGGAIVTGDTVIGYALVIKGGLGKRRGRMAHRAILGGRNMAWVHALGRTGAIGYMAGRTVVDDAGMIEYRRLEAAARRVAGTAILGRRQVAGVKAFCDTGAIGDVTGITARGQHRWISMVDERVGEINRVMAKGAVLGRVRMRRRRRFRPGAERHIVAVMARDTVAGDTFVRQHRGRGERGTIVANVAILRRRHVVRILHQIGAGIARQRQEKAHVTAFAAVGNRQMDIIPEVRGR